MSVYHFMGVGRAVGVVTCAVDYIEKALDTIENNIAFPETHQFFQGSGVKNYEQGIDFVDAPKLVEAIDNAYHELNQIYAAKRILIDCHWWTKTHHCC
jgi:hypothetical protein